MQEWQLDAQLGINNSSSYKCFAEVEAKADILLSENRTFLNDFRSKSLSDDCAIGSTGWHIALVNHFCSLPAKRLAQVLHNFQQEYFILAFDECAHLDGHWSLPNQTGMSLVALRRIIRAADSLCLKDVTFWFLLLETRLTIPNMFFNAADISSFKPEHRVLLPPWSYLGFNQLVGVRHSEDIQRPSDVLSVQHLKAYGRPVGLGILVMKLLTKVF
jgi:hypothetical protein